MASDSFLNFCSGKKNWIFLCEPRLMPPILILLHFCWFSEKKTKTKLRRTFTKNGTRVAHRLHHIQLRLHLWILFDLNKSISSCDTWPHFWNWIWKKVIGNYHIFDGLFGIFIHHNASTPSIMIFLYDRSILTQQNVLHVDNFPNKYFNLHKKKKSNQKKWPLNQIR